MRIPLPFYIIIISILCINLTKLPAYACEQAPKEVTLEQDSLEHTDIYYVTIPKSSKWVLEPVIGNSLKTLPELKKSHPKALFMINAGYFDPVNGKTASYITKDGVITSDPSQNERLVNNKGLKPYLDKIFDRSEFRISQCNNEVVYDITARSTSLPAYCTLKHAIGAGPLILPALQLQEEAFVAYQGNKKVRDVIGEHSKNARSAMGLLEDGRLIMVMASQKQDSKGSSGVTLSELRNWMLSKGIVKGISLDGGSSSSIVYKDQAIFGKLNKKQEWVKRPVKSAWMLRLCDNCK